MNVCKDTVPVATGERLEYKLKCYLKEKESLCHPSTQPH